MIGCGARDALPGYTSKPFTYTVILEDSEITVAMPDESVLNSRPP